MIQVFLLFILGHLVGDFVTQTNSIVERKKEYWNFYNIKLSKGITEHVLHHFVITLVLSIVFYGLDFFLILALFLICIIHYFIDWAKSVHSDSIIQKYQEKEDKNTWYYLGEKHTTHFLIDQILHIISIYFILFVIGKVYSVSHLVNSIKDFIAGDIIISDESKVILLTSLLILLVFTSGYLIKSIFKDIRKDDVRKAREEIAASAIEYPRGLELVQSDIENINKNLLVEHTWEVTESGDKETKRSTKYQYQDFNERDNEETGKYIGYLERLLIGIFVVLQAYPSLALLGAFKTLTRFKQFESKSFAEYYLIGTLLSMVFGLIFGLLIQWIIFS